MKTLLILFVLCLQGDGGSQGGGNPYTSQPDPDVVAQDPCSPSNDIGPPPGPVPCSEPDCLESALSDYQQDIAAINANTCDALNTVDETADQIFDSIQDDYIDCLLLNPAQMDICLAEFEQMQEDLNESVDYFKGAIMDAREDLIGEAAFDYWQAVNACCSQQQ